MPLVPLVTTPMPHDGEYVGEIPHHWTFDDLLMYRLATKIFLRTNVFQNKNKTTHVTPNVTVISGGYKLFRPRYTYFHWRSKTSKSGPRDKKGLFVL